MDESDEVGGFGHFGRGDRVQVGDDGLGVGVDVGASGQSGESGAGVELEEGGLEVLAVHEDDGLDLNVDRELSAKGDIRYTGDTHCLGGCLHGDFGNGTPDGVGESVESWLLGRTVIRRLDQGQRPVETNLGHRWLIE